LKRPDDQLHLPSVPVWRLGATHCQNGVEEQEAFIDPFGGSMDFVSEIDQPIKAGS
jgi:hypothetical protein